MCIILKEIQKISLNFNLYHENILLKYQTLHSQKLPHTFSLRLNIEVLFVINTYYYTVYTNQQYNQIKLTKC